VLARFANAGVVAVLLAASAACGSPSTPADPTAEAGERLEASRVAYFNSIEELARYSSVIAVVRATPESTVELVETFPFTVTVVDVIRGIRGTEAGTRLKIRQIGAEKAVLIDSPPILESRKVYLLFLDRFKWSDKEVTDQYVITGISGQFEETSPGTFRRQDPQSKNLPGTLTESAARNAVAAQSYVEWSGDTIALTSE
jgi:hypothetical protein